MRARSLCVAHHALKAYGPSTRSVPIYAPCSWPIRNAASPAHHVPRRALTLPALSTVLLPPTVFAGLLLALWTYKCLMLVIFQHKIIYMPYLPPFARSEKLADYAAQCGPVRWREEWVTAQDGVQLAMAVGQVESEKEGEEAGRRPARDVVVVHLHGNGGSVPLRLPLLSQALQRLHATQLPPPAPFRLRYTLVALSYRGYWRSRGRPSEPGLVRDAAAALSWCATRFPAGTPMVLWGQSLGAAVATAVAADVAEKRLGTPPAADSGNVEGREGAGVKLLPITGLVLETPFVSMRRMLASHNPQRWVPYQYLWPFLRSRWDNVTALRRLSAAAAGNRRVGPEPGGVNEGAPPVLLLQASKDEVVPGVDAGELEGVAQTARLRAKLVTIDGALHNGIMATAEGRIALAVFSRDCVQQTSRKRLGQSE